MNRIIQLSLIVFMSIGFISAQVEKDSFQDERMNNDILSGVERIDEWIHLLRDKRLGLVVNQSSHFKNGVHLVDSLINRGMSVEKIFAPEHGFRGKADAGETVVNGRDVKTGIPILSLYGNNKKPSSEMLDGVDIIIFDIQDVGVRFYTYISTLEYVMEAAAENGITFMILDRPNPNGHYVDGPVLEKEFSSFVGMQKIPIVHGLTVGEYAKMLIGESMIKIPETFDVRVITCDNYTHSTKYILPTAPSPNLPNQKSILLYPTLCLFEGTVFSVGRGTNNPFQVIGHPDYYIGSYSFTPQSMPGAKNPKLLGEECYGISFKDRRVEELYAMDKINIELFVQVYNDFVNMDKNYKTAFFKSNNFIDKLYGSDAFRILLMKGADAQTIRESWEPELSEYKEMRKKYLLYD